MLIDVSKLKFPVVSCNEQTIVVIKPAGMATELTTDPRRAALISRLRAAAAPGVEPRLVHRLDRVTRGIVIVALTREAASFYGEQIREGVWEKFYLARIPSPDPGRNPLHAKLVGTHKAHIKEEAKHARIVRAGGKPSLLEIVALDAAPGKPGQHHALIRLLTGRLHQIRVMMAALELPLTGDDVYGGSPGSFFLEHAALWYVDAATREVRLAFSRDDPERERLGPAVTKALERVTRGRG